LYENWTNGEKKKTSILQKEGELRKKSRGKARLWFESKRACDHAGKWGKRENKKNPFQKKKKRTLEESVVSLTGKIKGGTPTCTPMAGGGGKGGGKTQEGDMVNGERKKTIDLFRATSEGTKSVKTADLEPVKRLSSWRGQEEKKPGRKRGLSFE